MDGPSYNTHSEMLSYHHTPNEQTLSYTTRPALLADRANKSPEMECYVFLEHRGPGVPLGRRAITYQELQERSINVAARLIEMGLKPGDRVGMFGRSTPEWLYVEYACLRIQVLCIPIPVSLVYSDQLGTFLQQHRIETLVMDLGHDADIVQKIGKNLVGFQEMVKGEYTSTNEYPARVLFLQETTGQALSVQDMVSKASDKFIELVIEIQTSIQPDDAAVIYATSGSTGIPKLVARSHFAFINVMQRDANMLLGLPEGDVYFNDRPLSWIASFNYLTVIQGCKRVHLTAGDITQEDYAKCIFQVVHDEKVNSLMLMTYMLYEMRKLMETGQCRFADSCRQFMTGGEKTSSDMISFFKDFVTVVATYACTEVELIAKYNSCEDFPASASAENGSLLYKPVVEEVSIVDDQGGCVPRGTPGLLRTRQVMSFSGYLDDPAATEAAITPSGWITPGDIFIMHPSDHLEFISRKGDVIIKGAIKIYPSKQEAMLLAHEKVGKAVVCGIPDEQYHDEICACIVPKSGSDVTVEELRAHCSAYQPKAQRVPLVPKHYLILDALPQTPRGKLDKRAIQSRFVEMAKSE